MLRLYRQVVVDCSSIRDHLRVATVRLLSFSAGEMAILCILSLMIFCGCDSPSGALAGADIASGPHAASENDESTQPETILLERDFGIVRPTDKLRYVFEVKNETSHVWTLHKTKSGCSCTVARATSETIEPGTSENFELLYDAPSSRSDDQRSVYLIFEEEDAPMVELRITARVRKPMTITPVKIDVKQLAIGGNTVRILKVENYSNRDWVDLKVTDSPDWVTIQGIFPERSSNDHARQTWKIECQLRNAKLPPGIHHGELTLQARGTEFSRSIAVSVVSVGPVSAVPSILMFRKAGQDGTAEASVVVSFVGVKPPEDPGHLLVRKDIPGRIDLTWEVLTKDKWMLKACYSPEDTNEMLVSGKIVVSFPESGFPDLTLPVHARVVPAK